MGKTILFLSRLREGGLDYNSRDGTHMVSYSLCPKPIKGGKR